MPSFRLAGFGWGFGSDHVSGCEVVSETWGGDLAGKTWLKTGLTFGLCSALFRLSDEKPFGFSLALVWLKFGFDLAWFWPFFGL